MCTVSVVINCYNGAQFLVETLDSVLDQTFKDFEVVFIDNCSTDNSAEIAKSYGEKIKYYRTKKNVSLGEARNYALKKCNGKYVAFLDSDDLWESNKLDIQVKIMDNNEDCVITIANNYVLNMMTDKRSTAIKKFKSGILNYDDFGINYKFGLSSIMIRKAGIEKLPFCFDTRLSYAEEFDFLLRLAQRGSIIYSEELLSTYRLHGSMHSLKLKHTIPKEYNMVLENLKNDNADFERYHENVIQRIKFLRDYTRTKLFIEERKLKKSRETIKPYITYNVRAKFFYFITFLPESFVQFIYSFFFLKKTL